MKKLKKNNKGFTLIELLADIVILGVLMIIAVPMVSKYIMEAKKNAFVATAKAYVSSARYAYLNGDYNCPVNLDSGTGGAVYIDFNLIQVDKTGGKSSFNQNIAKNASYVVIKSDVATGSYEYYVRMVDEGGNGWATAIKEEDLKKGDVKNSQSQTAISSASYTGGTTTDKCSKAT